MQFARPPQGFNISISSKAKKQLDEIFLQYPNFTKTWGAIEKRIAVTGHREGIRVTALKETNAFLLSVDADPLPVIQLVYTILGITLTVQSVRTL